MTLVLPTRRLDLDFGIMGYASGDIYPDEASKLDSRITFTRSSTATRINASGVLESVAANQPRFDFDPVSLQCRGILVEEQRTNPVLYSGDFSNAVWSKTAITVSGGTSLMETTANDYHFWQQSFTFTAGSAVLWARVKANGRNWIRIGIYDGADRNAFFNLSAGTVGTTTNCTASISPDGSGYFKCVVKFTALAASGSVTLLLSQSGATAQYAGNTSAGVICDHVQLEQGATYETSRIPTTSAAVTRAADSAVITSLSPWFSAAEGTLLAEIVGASGTAIASLSDNSTNNRIALERSQGIVTTGGVAQAQLSWSAASKAAIGYKANAISAVADGGTVQADTSATIPTVSRLELGTIAGGSHLNGCLKRLSYWGYKNPSDLVFKNLTA